MRRITRLNENDLNRIVRRVIREEEDRSMTTQMFNTAKQKYDNGQRNPSLEKKIKNCITKNRLKSLFWLTTARGAYILGLIAVGFLIPGLDGVEVGALAAIYIIYVIASERNIIENNISNDVKKLCDCLF
jgi:hypothetical protein